MAWQDPTTINWTQGMGSFFAYINSVTLGWASRMTLIGIYVIVLSAYYKARDDFFGAIAVAGISTFIVALLGWMVEPAFIDTPTLIIVTALMFIGVAVIMVERPHHFGTA